MDKVTFILSFLVGLFGLIYVWIRLSRQRSTKNNRKSFEDLPTPKGYPILGHLTKMGSLPHVTLTKWSRKFGPLYRIRMGLQDVLIVSGLTNIRKALLKNSIAFAGRPHFEMLKIPKEEGGISIAFSDYSPEWLIEKGIAKAAISLYTTGKDPTKRSIMEISSYKHANSLVDQLLKEAKSQKMIVNPGPPLVKNIINVICKICFGEEFEMEDPAFVKLLELHKKFDKAFGISQTADFWPLLKYIPVVSRAFKDQRKFNKYVCDIVKQFLETHWKTYDDKNVRDLVDSLYYERKKHRETVNNKFETNSVIPDLKTDSGTEAEETKITIIGSANVIFQAGFDTTYTMLHWALLYFAVFPETQTKIREEIENILSPDEQPSFRLHAGRCHYTVAWIYELMRHVSPLPILFPHTTTDDIVFEKYHLPKSLCIYFNVYQVHNDPELWESPELFYPERFLDTDTRCFKPNLAANILAWGMGKRFCPAKDLSKHIMFIFITTLIRRLEIHPSIPGIEPRLPWPVEFGISMKPKEYKIKVIER